jgi:hypothetical protein
MKQIQRTLRPDTAYLEKWDKTVDMVHWESNSLIKRHPHIDPDKIIAKSSTDEFPDGAITVRFRSQATREVGVYFYGEKKNRTWNNGQNSVSTFSGSSYNYIDKKLRVTLRIQEESVNRYGFSFQGELPENVDTEGLKIALDYIVDTIEEIN